MLHAHVVVGQIMDMFEVRCTITEFSPGVDPVTWTSTPESFVLPDGWEQEDALSTTLHLIRLWSERTIQR